jgi:uncharacterized protein YdiU (UPF0061 family)
MQENSADFTNTFDALARGDARNQLLNREGFDQWRDGWIKRLERENDPQEVMQKASPRVIPRNHRIEEMIAAAVDGNLELFHRLMRAYSTPYATDDLELMRPPTKDQRVPATFCGT